jgi:hypothetical protein
MQAIKKLCDQKKTLIFLVYVIAISIGHINGIINYPEGTYKILRALELTAVCTIAFFAYKDNKIATWILCIHMFFTGFNTFMMGVFRGSFQTSLKTIYIIFGVFSIYGSVFIILNEFKIKRKRAQLNEETVSSLKQVNSTSKRTT